MPATYFNRDAASGYVQHSGGTCPAGVSARPIMGMKGAKRLGEESGEMASIWQRARDFLRSPQGRRLTEQVKRAARDPKNQQRVREAVRRLRKR